MVTLRKSPVGGENLIDEISRELSLSKRFTKILLGRGIDSVDGARKFLNPSLSSLGEPFSMHGIRAAVDRLTLARDNGESVVVYGDYDADGISAAAVLTRSLKIFGIDACAVIPERDDGYGLSTEVIERTLEEYCPDLLVTVDCGISGAEEVEYLKDLGVDVIVTDHHELPDELPECVVVNCKIDDGKSFRGLCGAGVAYKLSRALIGEKADEFLDMVAVATLADSMPLIDENRAIVGIGLSMIASGKCSEVIKALVKVSQPKEITATSVAFTLAPRINAAGRMGDAACALKAFLSDAKGEIDELVGKLNEYNLQRQSECDLLYKSAKSKLADKSPTLMVNVLADKSWKTGLVGIVAAKIAEETGKPTILFAEREGVWHGSARSVGNVNIFDALKSAEEFIEFGGHAQAAGVTVADENLGRLENALDCYFSNNGNLENLNSAILVDEFIDEPLTLDFIDELDRLEPCGCENPRPSFAVFVNDAFASPLKFGSTHVSFKTDAVDLLYFNGYDDLKLLNSSVKKAIVFEPNSSTFNGKRTVKGYVRNIFCLPSNDAVTDCVLFANQLDNRCQVEYFSIGTAEVQAFIDAAKSEIYGTLFVIDDLNNLSEYVGLEAFTRSALFLTGKGNISTLCYGLKGEVSKLYKRVVYLDKPLNFAAEFPEKTEVYVNTRLNGLSLSGISADRKVMGEIYTALKRSERSFARIGEFAEYLNGQFGLKQLHFAIKVFRELGLVKISNGVFYAVAGEKCELSQSELYSKVNDMSGV